MTYSLVILLVAGIVASTVAGPPRTPPGGPPRGPPRGPHGGPPGPWGPPPSRPGGPPGAPSVAEQVCVSEKAQEEMNKRRIREGYLKLFNDHDIESVDQYFHKDYIEHNPNEPGGTEGLKEAMRGFLQSIPKGQIDIRKLMADGDYVWTHVKFPAPGQPGKFWSVMDCFRMQNSMIMEHWDVMMPIAELKDSKNPHPMF